MCRPKARGVVLFLCMNVSAFGLAHAAIPLTINQHRIVKVDGFSYTGNVSFKFGFLNDGANHRLRTNDDSQVGTNLVNVPTNSVTVSVADGIYNVQLHDAASANMVAISSSVFEGDDSSSSSSSTTAAPPTQW